MKGQFLHFFKTNPRGQCHRLLSLPACSGPEYCYYIVIFMIWMGNWGMVLANIEQVVRKEKGRTNRMIQEK